MFKNFLKYKFLTILFSLLIISAIVSPILKDYFISNWPKILEEKIQETEFQISNEFQKKLDRFSEIKNKLKSEIELNTKINLANDFSFIIVDEKDSVFDFKGFYADKIEKDYGPNLSDKYFQNNLINTFIACSDNITIAKENYRLIVTELIEKKYDIENDFFIETSFTKYLSEKYKIDLSINYGRDSLVNSDGRTHQFRIPNNDNEILATVTFAKPGRDIFISNQNEIIKQIQSILAIILLIAFFYEIIKDIKKKLISENVFSFVFIILIFVFRFAIYFLGFPSSFFGGDFVSPAIYSSSFGWGIASNPLELIISSITILSIVVILNKKISSFVTNKLNAKYISIISIIALSILFFFFIRGYAAVIKSIIFDSSINYLNNNSLILDFVPSTVILSSLFITIAVFLVLYNFIDGLINLIQNEKNISELKSWIIVFIILQVVGSLFDLIQHEPLLSSFLRIILVTGLFIVYIISKKENYKSTIIITHLAILAAVINSILIANFDNDKDEHSIKVVAYELTRFDEDFIEVNLNLFLFDEFYSLLEQTESASINYDQFLFFLWSNSALKENILNSSFYLFDSELNKLGDYSFNQSEDYTFFFKKYFIQKDNHEPEIFNESIYANSNSLIGVTSFRINGKKYYLGLKVNYDLKSLIASNEPDFLLGKQKYLLSNQSIENLLIMQLKDYEVFVLNSNIKIDKNEKELLFSAEFNNHNDAWKEIEIDGILYKFYFLKSNHNSGNSIAIGLQEKEASITLFQFFKIFLIFALFILIYGIAIVVLNFVKQRKVIIDFRSKLAFSLIIISIAPIILLAVYFRNLTNEKNLDAIFYKLNKRSISVEEYINKRISDSEFNILKFAKNANDDLGIDFNIYSQKEIVFSTRSNLYNSGIFPSWISSEVFDRLFIQNQNDILLTETIENQQYNSIYYKTKINNEIYVFEVNDLFNSILIPLAISDFDIILFGTYSLAAIFVIILSTILANQISLPLRRLTNAAKSASYGDLNLNIEYKRKDEIGELTNAFNKMLNEIKKMQTDLSTVERETAWKEIAKQVAHEIKNPLTPMKLSMQQLIAAYNDKSPKFDEIFSKVSRTILGQVENLRNIASEFSNFARMPIGEMTSVNLKEIITEVANLFVDERIKIDLTFPKNPIRVNGDENHFKRIFINLIRNSIQAKADKLSVNIEEIEDSIKIKIEDNGEGIQKEFIDKIFSKGFTTKKEGMGLGLNLAKRYLNNISSDISIESSSVNGTIFSINLPHQKKI